MRETPIPDTVLHPVFVISVLAIPAPHVFLKSPVIPKVAAAEQSARRKQVTNPTPQQDFDRILILMAG